MKKHNKTAKVIAVSIAFGFIVLMIFACIVFLKSCSPDNYYYKININEWSEAEYYEVKEKKHLGHLPENIFCNIYEVVGFSENEILYLTEIGDNVVMKHHRYLKTTVILIVICLLAGGIAYLKWDDSKSSYETFDMDRDFLQSELNRFPIPEEKQEGEAAVKQGRFKGIVSYYMEPVSQAEAEEYNSYLQSEDTWYLGTYVPLEGISAGALVGRHYYSSVLETIGYGWFSYDGNLYADYYGREKAKEKLNYRHKYEFYLVKDAVTCKIVIFCNQGNPEKALSVAIDYISEL